MFTEAFYKFTEQFEEYIFLRGMWHFMSFIGEGKERTISTSVLVRYCFVFFVLFFRFESCKLIGTVRL